MSRATSPRGGRRFRCASAGPISVSTEDALQHPRDTADVYASFHGWRRAEVRLATCAVSAALAATVLLPGAPPAAGARVGPSTVRVSLSSSGVQAHRGSIDPVVSRNGRFVAFESRARSLVKAGTDDGYAEVFLRDLVRGRTWLVSRSNDGRRRAADCRPVSVTNSGRFVMFEAQPRTFNPRSHGVFVRDRTLHRTRTVDTIKILDGTVGVDLSDDGRYATFLRGYSGSEQLYQRDLVAGTTHLIASGGNTPGTDMLEGGQMARDGSRIFYTSANVLYVHRRGRKHDWSISSPFAGQALARAITPDTRYVLFDEWRPDPVTGSPHIEVYRYDRRSAVTTRVSVGPPPYTSTPTSQSISNDGRYVAFLAARNGYSDGDVDGHSDLLIRDLQTQTTTRASVAAGGADFSAPAGSGVGRILSADGSTAVFYTSDPAVAGDTNGVRDVYARIGLGGG